MKKIMSKALTLLSVLCISVLSGCATILIGDDGGGIISLVGNAGYEYCIEKTEEERLEKRCVTVHGSEVSDQGASMITSVADSLRWVLKTIFAPAIPIPSTVFNQEIIPQEQSNEDQPSN